MRLARHHRRVLLYLAIVLVPGGLLLVATIGLFRQEQELLAQRRAQAEQLIAAQLGQVLRGRLDQLRLAAPDSNDEAQGAPGAVVVMARAVGDRLILPWQEPRPAAATQNADADVVAATHAEFVAARYADAALLYERAGRNAKAADARADALLMAARAHARAGHAARANELYHELAALDPGVRDADGFPHAIYALDALFRSGDIAPGSFAVLRRVLSDAGTAPTVLHAVADLNTLAAGAAADSAAMLDRLVQERLRDAERALALAAEFAGLRALAVRAANTAAAGVAWLPFGEELWLVGVPATRAAPADSALSVLVARPAPLLGQIANDDGALADAAAAARLGATPAHGAPLGPEFPGINVRFDASFSPLPNRSFGTALLLLVVPVVMGVLAFTTYLLWRDVRREVAAAALRAHFVSSVSHELKTPLTSIRMFTDLIRSGNAPRETDEEYLEIIGSETERLTRLINNVLDFSRIEREGRTYHKAPTVLADVVRDAARAMAYPLAQDGFELRLGLHDAVPPVRADRDAITQAVLNLLSNAMKFSGTSRTIDLNLTRENGAAVIQVVDRGHGIDPAEHRVIFENFYRSPVAEAHGIPGTGLGLSLVAHVAAGHGGSVQVDSEPGRGSSFALILPLDPA